MCLDDNTGVVLFDLRWRYDVTEIHLLFSLGIKKRIVSGTLSEWQVSVSFRLCYLFVSGFENYRSTGSRLFNVWITATTNKGDVCAAAAAVAL